MAVVVAFGGMGAARSSTAVAAAASDMATATAETARRSTPPT